MNELHKESSPYLLQHANNPIYWKAWNDNTLELAKTENKLIVISIGYSTCHWCHVMEKESFENQEVADCMNDTFISIKIDREEFPNVDTHYMKAVQLMTKQGGWPLNVVCLPDGRPIWGGTYFKKDVWLDSLNQLQQLYVTKPDTVIDFATKLTEGITILGFAPQHQDATRFNLTILLDKWSKSFDAEYGGYNRAPKFMMPTNLLFLQRYGSKANDNLLLSHVDTTLTRMAWGGIFDTLEGGFSRYAVDYKWHVPHFEKMLYDNAQLLSVYSEAFCRTKNPLYKEILIKTIQFIDTNWKQESGGYYSALDADSLNNLNILEEGAYYVWTKNELETLLQEDFAIFSKVFNINSFGYWEHNNYVLIQDKDLETIATENNLTLKELVELKTKWEATLLQVRKQRIAPRLDNKIITSWNMMLVTGLVDTALALQEPKYLSQAEDLMSFANQHLLTSEGELIRKFQTDQTSISAYLDDYAFYIQASLALYQGTGDLNYLNQAKNVMDLTLDYFLDSQSGFFYYSKNNTASIISRHIETEDNVIPSSNAIMALNLHHLGILYEHDFYTKLAEEMTATVCSQIDYASAYSHWLIAHQIIEEPTEISLVGNITFEHISAIKQQYWNNTLIFPVIRKSNVPYLQKYTIEEQSLFYKCEGKSCYAPLPIDVVITQKQEL
ncbi:MAG: thioredoxin domain-containing protein [Flavobacteriaceae bacterium]|jgi:uncharacterized protein YyaL (SSP411 family)|nr:thioredoxin domain-containing protein [Flavobacteriaceae bacterium]